MNPELYAKMIAQYQQSGESLANLERRIFTIFTRLGHGWHVSSMDLSARALQAVAARDVAIRRDAALTEPLRSRVK